MRVEVVIPAYEPDERLAKYVADLQAAGFTELTIVDDGSGSRYSALFGELEQAGCNVLYHAENKGKGAALKTAFFALKNKQIDAVITADCDGQHTAADVRAVADALEKAPGTLVLAQRIFDENTPKRSMAGNRSTSAALRILYDIDLPDTQTGLRGIPAPMLEAMSALPGDRYEYELNMLMWAKRNAIEFTQVPIEARYFDNNAGSHYRTVRDSLPILWRVLSGVVHYGFSATFSAVIDVLAYCVLIKLLLENLPLEAKVVASAVIARTLSSFANYLCNRKLPTAQNKSMKGTVWKYYCLWAVQLVASIAGTTLLCEWLGIDEMFAKLLTDLLLALFSYQIQLRWVFAKSKKKTETAERETECRLMYWAGWMRFLKRCAKVLTRYELVQETALPDQPCVYVVHHQNLFGPAHALIALPESHMWVLWPFCEKKACFDQYYGYTFTKRFGWPKPLAFVTAKLLSSLVPPFFRALGAVPVFRTRARLRETLRISAELLTNGESLIISPDVDYQNESAFVGETYAGFVGVAGLAQAQSGIDVPFVPVHCSKQERKVYTGTPIYCKKGRAERLECARRIGQALNELAGKHQPELMEDLQPQEERAV